MSRALRNMLSLFSNMVTKFHSSVIHEKSFVQTIKSEALGSFVKKPTYLPKQVDILIVGGGVMGNSIAFWLKHRTLEGLSVAVVEKDPSYHQSTSALSVGGLRQQFSLKENIELSMKSAEFFRNISDYLSIDGLDPPDIQFYPCGYLFLASEKGVHILEENNKLQRSLGAKVELLSPDTLKERYPWLNVDGIVCGSHGLENEGWLDPYSLLFAFKRKAIHLGAEYVPGEVVKFIPDVGSQERSIDGLGRAEFHKAIVKLQNGVEHQIEFGKLVIAAGGHSGQLAELLGVGSGCGPFASPLPVEPRSDPHPFCPTAVSLDIVEIHAYYNIEIMKRYVFNIHCPTGPGVAAPMVIDCSGAYFRREGLTGHYLCGISPTVEEEPPIDNLDVDYSFFEEKLWPILANRVPAFENAKIKSAWAGFYDFNRFDENGFIGLSWLLQYLPSKWLQWSWQLAMDAKILFDPELYCVVPVPGLENEYNHIYWERTVLCDLNVANNRPDVVWHKRT